MPLITKSFIAIWKTKRRSKVQILIDRHNMKKAVLRKDRKKKMKVLNERTETTN